MSKDSQLCFTSEEKSISYEEKSELEWSSVILYQKECCARYYEQTKFEPSDPDLCLWFQLFVREP